MVGAVLVLNGNILAEDYHKRAGDLHAEALAIQKAGKSTHGSVLYVTLEPCCHTDKRTPPCTSAVINAGIIKVFVAMKDPNPKVSGRGIETLRSKGIEVVEGLLEDKALRLNEVYIKYITTKTPFVVLKTAMTLDGKIATPEGESKWITGEKARAEVHRMRSRVDAVLTAAGTVRADNPELTVRLRGREGRRVKNPIRIVIDPRLELPSDCRIFNNAAETIVVADRTASMRKKQQLYDKGIKIMECEGRRVDLEKLMLELGDIGITSVMVEAGSSFSASALEAGIVDKVVFFIAPKIIRGRASIPVIGGNTFMRLEDAHRIKDMKVHRFGEDLMIEGYPER
jgi:diaminohydroxyphosphoribosylaminopyrimidine deaminase/5-amino-6-(5-phosphoribosylamino)uracil reductase